MVRRLSIVPACLAALLGLVHTNAEAADFSQITSLRAEAERLERDPPPGVPPGSLTSILYLLQVAELHQGDEPANAARYLANAGRLLAHARAGRDPMQGEREFVIRAYRSRTSLELQPYSVYVPRDYDPSRPRAMLVGMHGGACNHSLYLAVVMGNGIPWWQYRMRHRDKMRPQWHADTFVVTVEGFGHPMYRWMAERDVLDVIKDVSVHYAIDPDRITLTGLSNGGVGCFGIGVRHAWRWNAVVCGAAAPSWILYGGQGDLSDSDRFLMSAYGALEQAENFRNTRLEFFHGRRDPGPMRPAYAQRFAERLRELVVPHVFHDLAAHGHDLINLMHDGGELERRMAALPRQTRPREVELVAFDLRAARQHWIEVTSFETYGERATARGRVTDGRLVEIATSNVGSLTLHLGDIPGDSERIDVVLDGDDVPLERGGLGMVAREDGRWRPLDTSRAIRALETSDRDLRKRTGLSGPLTDAYFDRMVFVFGTRDSRARPKLERAARFAASGWPLWLYGYRAPVLPEDDVTDELMRTNHVVVFGTPTTSSLVARLADRLPIGIEPGAIVFRGHRLRNPSIGVRLIYPNVLAGGSRYVIVQSGATVDAVLAGNNLPDFLPDYVIYDATTTRTRPRLVFGRQRSVAEGFFDAHWQLP